MWWRQEMGWSDKGALDREQSKNNDEGKGKQDRVNGPSGSWDWLEF